MPYRDLERAGPSCYRHAVAPATETCTRCLAAICDICVGFEDTQVHCPPCAQKVRRRRAARRTLGGALGLFVVLGALAGMGWMAARDYSEYHQGWVASCPRR